MSNQTNELKKMMGSFFQMNTASSSGSGSLPSNIVANPRGFPLIPKPLFEDANDALIDFLRQRITLRVDDEAITFKVFYEWQSYSVFRSYPFYFFPLSHTPFEEGDFILEEIKACLTNDLIPPGIDDDDFDPEGDLLLLEKLLIDYPSSPLPLKELNPEELKIVKYYIDDPPELELKDLPSYLEYAFLEGTDKLNNSA
ncbi:hypothetical protein Tco_1546742 [Tanacetum coccineum]